MMPKDGPNAGGGYARPVRKNNDVFRQQFHKVSLCQRYIAGKCAKGDRCTYAHSVRELQPAPDTTKTSICAAWKKGKCPNRASECKFAHGKVELRMSKEFVQLAARQFRKDASGEGASPAGKEKLKPPAQQAPQAAQEAAAAQFAAWPFPGAEPWLLGGEYFPMFPPWPLHAGGLWEAAEQTTYCADQDPGSFRGWAEYQELSTKQFQAGEGLDFAARPPDVWSASTEEGSESDVDQKHQEAPAHPALAERRASAAPPHPDEPVAEEGDGVAGRRWDEPLYVLLGESGAGAQLVR